MALLGLVLTPSVPGIASTMTFTGNVSSTGTAFRSHRFEVPEPGIVTITLDWDDPAANLNLFLRNPSGTQVASSTRSKPEVITYDVVTTGAWSIAVKAVSGSADYTAIVDLPGANPGTPTWSHTVGGPGHADIAASGLDIDASGTMYVADTANDQVEAYSPTGEPLWSEGTRKGTDVKALGRFSNPRDVAYLDGYVYVADTGNNRVQVKNLATGAWSAWAYRFGSAIGITAGVAESTTTTTTTTLEPTTNAPTPILLVAEDSSSTIKLFTPGGTLLRTVGRGVGSGNGQLKQPRDAATDAQGNIYVADYANDRVAKFGPNGTWLANWGSKGNAPGQFGRPYGIAVDARNRVYVADANNGRIQVFNADGTLVYRPGTDPPVPLSWGSLGTQTNQFFHLRRVAVGAGDSPAVYGADLWGYKVLRFQQSGTAPDAVYGNVAPPAGRFNEPNGLAVDATSTFVADTDNQRVQRFETASPYANDLVWGTRGFGVNEPGFNWPRDLTIEPSRNTVWVADTKNHRLTEFGRDGSPTGQGLGSVVGSTKGQLNWPYAVAAGSGDLFVADTFNNRIERWDPDTPCIVAPNPANTDCTASVVWMTASAFGVALGHPMDLTVVGNTVYVADTDNHRIVKLDATTGAPIDSALGASVLHSVQGVAVEPATGHIWASDTNYNRLVQLSGTGTVLQTFGSLGFGSSPPHGQFNWPGHLEILERTGQPPLLFVADTWNDRIEVFTLGT